MEMGYRCAGVRCLPKAHHKGATFDDSPLDNKVDDTLQFFPRLAGYFRVVLNMFFMYEEQVVFRPFVGIHIVGKNPVSTASDNRALVILF